MKITFEKTRLEVPSPRNGKPGYKWVDGLYIVVNGNRHYPPLRIREAKAYAKKLEIESSALPVRPDVEEATYHRPPTEAEIRFGHGATHYRTFPIEECTHSGTRILKKWFVASADGLRYYR